MSDKSERAFPVPSEYTDKGMTLRDWFAGQALVGIITRSAMPKDSAAQLAYAAADAMLAQRAKPPVANGAVKPTLWVCKCTNRMVPVGTTCQNCGKDESQGSITNGPVS